VNKDSGEKIYKTGWILRAKPMELTIAKILGERLDIPNIKAYKYKGKIYIVDWTQ